MKKFAALFVAVCLVVLFSSESQAQCRGGGFYGGGFSGGGVGFTTGRSFRSFNAGFGSGFVGPGFGVSYGRSFYSRPYVPYSRYQGFYNRPYSGRGISIRF